ncbi:MAG: hypothetical protein ACFFD4_13075 [Candidatus Odinarchaeota archaeon]
MSLEEAKMALYKRYKKGHYVKDQRALEAFLKVKREEFLPEKSRHVAYVDSPISLFEGQTMSAPHMKKSRNAKLIDSGNVILRKVLEEII